MPKKKTWVEKLNDNKGLPKVEKISDKLSKRWGSGSVVMPAPIEVDELMRKVPKGKLITINDIRTALAKKHKATIGCPHDHRHLRLGRSKCCRRTRTKRRERHPTLLVHLENRRVLERKVSRWRRSSKGTFEARRPHNNQEKKKT